MKRPPANFLLKPFAMVLMLCPVLLWSQQESDFPPLSVNEALSFEYLLDQAMANAPQIEELRARQEETEHYLQVGRSWLSGRPSLQLNYQDDRRLDNVGLKEIEYGIQLPLWRPGEKKLSQDLGDSYRQQTEAWQDYFRLTVAGNLRASLMNMREAELRLSLEYQALGDARQLLEMAQSMLEAGAISELALMQLRMQVLSLEKSLLEAEAMLVDAEREYAVLTGLKSKPARPHEEQRNLRTELEDSHPYLHYLQTLADLKSAEAGKTRISAKNNPTFTVGSRRERGSRADEYVDSLGLSLSIPFGGKAFVNSKYSSAKREQVEVEVLLEKARRELSRQLHEVEHQLFIIGQTLVISEQNRRLSQESWHKAKIAFELGETSMLEVINALQQSRAMNLDFELLKLRKEGLIQEYNQSLGELP